MLRKLPMNKFLIDCSFKSYSMAPKFDQLIQRYVILIPRYAAYCRAGSWSRAMPHSGGSRSSAMPH
jgi:hypothetical protein